MRIGSAFLSLVVVAGPLQAEQTPELPLGVRIRVTSFSLVDRLEPVAGTLLHQDTESITIRPRGGEALRLSRENIVRLELSQGHHSRRRGAVIGAVLGFVVGFGYGVAAFGFDGCVGCALEFEARLGAGLAIPGALIGVALPPAERWSHVTRHGKNPTRPQVSFTLAFP